MADDTDRVAVTTYVPADQRDVWRGHADEVDMSLSEFVRAMTQAGRREFEVPTLVGERETEAASHPEHPRGDALETRVLRAIKSEEYASWETLVERLADDFEDRLEDVLADLQAAGRVQYSGRRGGYTLSDDE